MGSTAIPTKAGLITTETQMRKDTNLLKKVVKDMMDEFCFGEGDEELMSQVIPQLWSKLGNTYSLCHEAVKRLPAGLYEVNSSPQRGIYLSGKDSNVDELMILPDSASELVVSSIYKFWSKEEHYRKFQFLWKRGILLFGPPGGGKTSTANIIAKRFIEAGGVVLYMSHPRLMISAVELVRGLEPKRPIMVIMEDIDTTINCYGEREILSLLDGESQVDNIVYVATTNYLNKLNPRIKNRPSRFDMVLEIGMPTAEARARFLTVKCEDLAKDSAELEKWIQVTPGFSIAHLKELIISVYCLELPFETSIARIKAMVPKGKQQEEERRDVNARTSALIKQLIVAEDDPEQEDSFEDEGSEGEDQEEGEGQNEQEENNELTL